MLAQFFSSLVTTAAPSRLANIIGNPLENPQFNLNDPAAYDVLTRGPESKAGVRVSHDAALSCAPVWQAVGMISGDVASMTLNCHKRIEDDDREIDDDHPAQPIVSVEWNEETSSNEGWRRLMAHALLWGNGYAWIQSRKGKPVALYNLLPDRTWPDRLIDGTLYYTTEIDGTLEYLRPSEILHIKGLSLETEFGLDLVRYAREAIGLALAAEGFSAKFYKQGCAAGGILEIPATFTEKAAQRLEEGFRKRTSGEDNWFKTAILRDGAKFHQLTIDASRSQTKELREDQVREAARFFNLPPGKLGVAGSVSYGSFEHSQLEYLSSCLTHWLRAVAAECGMKLLTREERHRTHYFEHNTSNWIEVDTATLWDVLGKGIASGVISPNEARRKLNIKRRNDPGGEEYGNPWTTPGGVVTEEGTDGVDDSLQQKVEAALEQQQRSEKQNQEQHAAFLAASMAVARNAFSRDASRFTRKLCNHARQQAKGTQKFADWIDTKAMDQRHLVQEMLGGVVEDAGLLTGRRDVLQSVEARFFAAMLDRLAPLLEAPHKAADLAANVDRECAAFENEIVPQLAAIVFGD